jgi:hypothetical protein
VIAVNASYAVVRAAQPPSKPQVIAAICCQVEANQALILTPGG